jgi:phosphate transport system permease protein
MIVLSVFAVALVSVIAAGLVIKSMPILSENSPYDIIIAKEWRPLRGEFGLYSFIAGTLYVTGFAILIVVPSSLLSAVYLVEYAPRKLGAVVKSAIDILAGIPSVVYGVWGVAVVVPFVKSLAQFFGASSSGYSVMSAGIVLAIMIFPVTVNVLCDIFSGVPRELREASLALGATRWQTVKHVIVKKSKAGIIAANMLGFCRAFGETMAVLMLAGNVALAPMSVFDPAYPLPALIANNYGEMMSVPLYDSALFLAALALFTVVVTFSAVSRAMVSRITRTT